MHFSTIFLTFGLHIAAKTRSLSLICLLSEFHVSCVSALQITRTLNRRGRIFNRRILMVKPTIDPREHDAVVGTNITQTKLCSSSTKMFSRLTTCKSSSVIDVCSGSRIYLIQLYISCAVIGSQCCQSFGSLKSYIFHDFDME